MTARIWITALAVAALTAGCSSSGSGSGSGAPPSRPAGGSTSGPAAPGAAVSIAVTGGRLTGPAGKTLYYNTVDTAAKITCVGTCAAIWPPVAGTPTAGSGVDAGDLATVQRPDGSTQVTYRGHPLYEFSHDAKAGDDSGEGVADGGGTWITATAPAAGGATSPATSPSSSSDDGGGYGY